MKESESTKSARIQFLVLLIGLIIALVIYLVKNAN